MAERKKPELGPVDDSSNSDKDKAKKQFILPINQFDQLVKMIKMGGYDIVLQIRVAVDQNMERLGLKPNPKKAVRKLNEEASSQVDVRSYVDWMEKLTKRTKRANAQLIRIHATLNSRMG